MWKEFKEFAMRGNVIDLAVGVVIGGAFGKIVSSFVADVIMPLIGLLLGKISFENKDYECAVKKDKFNDIFSKMLKADAMILGSPTYFAAQPHHPFPRAWKCSGQGLPPPPLSCTHVAAHRPRPHAGLIRELSAKAMMLQFLPVIPSPLRRDRR